MLHTQDQLENRVESLKNLVRELKSAKNAKKSFEKMTARINTMPIISEEDEFLVETNTIEEEMKGEQSDESEKVKFNLRFIPYILRLILHQFH